MFFILGVNLKGNLFLGGVDVRDGSLLHFNFVVLVDSMVVEKGISCSTLVELVIILITAGWAWDYSAEGG